MAPLISDKCAPVSSHSLHHLALSITLELKHWTSFNPAAAYPRPPSLAPTFFS